MIDDQVPSKMASQELTGPAIPILMSLLVSIRTWLSRKFSVVERCRPSVEAPVVLDD